MRIERGERKMDRRTFVCVSFAAFVLVAARRAFAQDSDPASGLVQQGCNFDGGNGTVTDYKRAAQYFQQAADAGSVDGQAWLGSMYLRGRGVTRDEAKGAQLISSSAQAGSAVGLRLMGLLYQKGLTVPQSYATARHLYEQAARKGDAMAYGRLGMLYLFGRGGPADFGKAESYLKRGASGGDTASMIELGMLYQRDHKKADRTLAFEQFTQAAAEGSRLGAYRLACAYHYGIGTKKNPTAVVKYLWQAAVKGHPPSQAALGSLYERGVVVPQNADLAYALYTLSSRNGSQRAAMQLHSMAMRMTVQQIQHATALADLYQSKNPQRRIG